MDKTIAFIPIRSGSKGIPDKNVRPLGGKPLVFWVVDTLVSLKKDIEIWVATDSGDYAATVERRYGDKVRVFLRSQSGASDSSPVIDAVKEFISHTWAPPGSRLILVQATTPFTGEGDFMRLLSAMDEGRAVSYVSCCRIKKFVWSDDGVPQNYALESKPMRQQYRGILVENGAFYASTVGAIMESGMLLSGKIGIVETGEGTMIDIDEPRDWRQAEHYISDILKK